MNVYDTANKLAGEIKQSEEYMNYKMAKQALSLNSKLKEQLQEFEKIRYEVQVELMQTGKNNEEKIIRTGCGRCCSDRTWRQLCIACQP